jgi:hypothetical protein
MLQSSLSSFWMGLAQVSIDSWEGNNPMAPAAVHGGDETIKEINYESK